MSYTVIITLSNLRVGFTYEARTRLGGCRTRVRRVQRGTRLPHLSFFFFFHGFALNQVDSARIEPYWPNRGVSAGDRNGPKRLKQAEIGLESCQNMSSHGGIGDADDKVEFLELGSVYGTSSILMFLFQVLHWDTLCLCL